MRNNAVQKNIPDGWKQVRLRDLTLKIGSGVTPRGGSEVYTTQGIKFLRSQNIQNGYIDLSDVALISIEVDKKMITSRVLRNDVLYNITGASIGRSAVYLLDEAANVNQHVCILRFKNDNPKFINAFLLSRKGINQLKSFQAGGNRQGLNYNQLGSFKFFIPSTFEQDRIVAVLETWDKAIEKLEKKIEIKKKIKKGLMHKLLTGESRLKEFKDKWETKKLGDIGRVSMCKRIFKYQTFTSGDIPFYKIGTFGKEPDAFISRKIYDEYIQKYSFPKKGEILISASGTIGRTVIYNGESAYFQDSNIIWISHDERSVLNSFLYQLYQEMDWQTESGTIARLYNDNVKRITISLPSLLEQKAIADILTAADNEINKLQKKLYFLKEQKKYLLNNLITGAIRTPEDLRVN